jgi:hypothetical protein
MYGTVGSAATTLLSKMKSLSPSYLWGKKVENKHQELGDIYLPIGDMSLVVWLKAEGLKDGTVRTALSLFMNGHNFIYYRKLSSDNLIRVQYQMRGLNTNFDYSCTENNWFMTTLTIKEGAGYFYVNDVLLGTDDEIHVAGGMFTGIAGAINIKGDSSWKGGVGYVGVYEPLEEESLREIIKSSRL